MAISLKEVEERRKARLERKKRLKRTSIEILIIKFILILMSANLLGI
ncbi:hypothetical protein [Thioflexithrix psekupsensis]|nr:hypothetical protein [Thioflexithrix psekupsensis]